VTHHAGYRPDPEPGPTARIYATAPSGISPKASPNTGGLSIADRRVVTRLAHDVLSIRRWVVFFGVLVVLGLVVVLLALAAGIWVAMTYSSLLTP
jgi:hypothetical protein